jgi:hypothetical protein
MKCIEEIKMVISKIGGKEIKDASITDENMVLFSTMLKDNDMNFLLILNESEKIAIINLVYTFKQGYQNLGLDFYEILENSNRNLIMGYLNLLEDNGVKRISYKSTYAGDLTNFLGNNSFENFLLVSIDMVGISIDTLGVN